MGFFFESELDYPQLCSFACSSHRRASYRLLVLEAGRHQLLKQLLQQRCRHLLVSARHCRDYLGQWTIKATKYEGGHASNEHVPQEARSPNSAPIIKSLLPRNDEPFGGKESINQPADCARYHQYYNGVQECDPNDRWASRSHYGTSCTSNIFDDKEVYIPVAQDSHRERARNYASSVSFAFFGSGSAPGHALFAMSNTTPSGPRNFTSKYSNPS